MATQQIDYLVGPYTTNETQATEIKTSGFWKEEKKIPHRKQFCQNWQLTVKADR